MQDENKYVCVLKGMMPLLKSLCLPGPFVQENAGIAGDASQQNPGRTELRQGMLGSGGDWRAGDSQHNLPQVLSTQ